MTPYWEDGTVALYVGDSREILPALGVTPELIVADPPYEETSNAWDRWQDGWVATSGRGHTQPAGRFSFRPVDERPAPRGPLDTVTDLPTPAREDVNGNDPDGDA